MPSIQAGCKRKAPGPKTPKAPPLVRARSGGKLTREDWLKLLSAIAAGQLRATTEGAAMPRTEAVRGKADDGTTPAMQYCARFKAWDAGLPEPAEPRFNLPASELPAATSHVYTGHLSDSERSECKAQFLEQARRSAEEAFDLGKSEQHSALLRAAALDGVEWLEKNMSDEYAAELAHTDKDGTGRERVRQLHSPAEFIREYVRAIDPQYFESLGLSPEESYAAHAHVVYELMLATYETNLEMQAQLHGLPYVPFRGAFLRVDGLTIIINEAGHFQAYYSSDLLASEDIAQLKKCQTGVGMYELFKAGGQELSLVANATVHTDLWRAAADTRKLCTDAGGVERSKRTATAWRLAMENGEPEPYPNIARLAHTEQAWRLLLFSGYGATQENVRSYGDPSNRYTEGRLRIPPAEQQDMLQTVLRKVLSPDRFETVMAANSTLPSIEQNFFQSIHLQNVYASGAAIFEVHRKVYMLKTPGLTAEQLESIRHECNLGMNKDVSARLLRARADLAIAEQWALLALAKVCTGQPSGSGSYMSTRALEAALAELQLRLKSEHMANSQSRGGVHITLALVLTSTLPFCRLARTLVSLLRTLPSPPSHRTLPSP